jgi:hypothetical protein
MPPIRLSDSELDSIMTAAQPLAPEHRSAFLQSVAASLQSSAEVGPGSIYRAIAAAQREHFTPPLEAGSRSGIGKYARG